MGREIFLDEHIQPGAELVRRLNDHVSVKSAFWLMFEGDSEPYLYIASDQFSDGNMGSAIAEIRRITDSIDGYVIDPFHVRLIKKDDPLSIDALKLRSTDPRRPPRRLASYPFAGTFTQDLYIYPPAGVPVA